MPEKFSDCQTDGLLWLDSTAASSIEATVIYSSTLTLGIWCNSIFSYSYLAEGESTLAYNISGESFCLFGDEDVCCSARSAARLSAGAGAGFLPVFGCCCFLWLAEDAAPAWIWTSWLFSGRLRSAVCGFSVTCPLPAGPVFLPVAAITFTNAQIVQRGIKL